MTSNPKPAQLTRENLKTMTPEQIEAARQAGELDELLSGRKPTR